MAIAALLLAAGVVFRKERQDSMDDDKGDVTSWLMDQLERSVLGQLS